MNSGEKKLKTKKHTMSFNQSSGLGIRGRLFIGFGIIWLIFFIAIIITFYSITVTKNFSNRVINNDLPGYDRIIDLELQIYRAQTALQEILLTHNLTSKTDLTNAWNNINKIERELDEFVSNSNNNSLLINWQSVKSLLVSLRQIHNKVENLSAGITTSPQIQTNLSEITAISNKLFDIIDGPIASNGERVGGMTTVQYNYLHTGTQNIIADMNFIQWIEIMLIFVTIVAIVVIALLTSKSILRHINIFRQFSSQIASGDLSQYLNVDSNDEIGQLGQDLNRMTESLSTITKQITEACHNMVTTLEEVRRAVDVQSSGATEQASSINQITASLEEIEKSSSQTMEKAKALGAVAERTRTQGQLGLEAVEKSIQGMKSIKEKVQTIAQTILDLSNQTQQVGEITSAVNTLAQQSKMLALNASIEAAKAGEAGKGFAVVASEVKNLAEQSEQSTEQVQKILEEIRHATEKAVMVTEEGTKGVDQGTGLVEQTGEIVRSLSEVIYESTIASQQIEAAVRQEGVGIEQITVGMNEINQVTSSFVASANQTLEAINNLATIAKNLKKHVDTYKF